MMLSISCKSKSLMVQINLRLNYLFKVGSKAKVFPLIVDEYEPDTFEAVNHRIKQRFSNGGNKLVQIDLSNTDQVISIFTIYHFYKYLIQTEI